MSKPVIVFVSRVYPGQHGHLCEELNRTGMAEAWFLTASERIRKYGEGKTNLIPFETDGYAGGPPGYHYVGKQERSARISRGAVKALVEFQKKRKIDLVVCHYYWGAPQFFYHLIDAPIISYVEYPSFRMHGWDPKYPPSESQRMTDASNEMLAFHQILRSDLTIVPTAYAKSLLPQELQPKVVPIFEGLRFGDLTPAPRTEKRFTIAFSARDLSSCKGLEMYARLVHRLVQKRQKFRFLAIGDEKAPTYSYEPQWLERTYGTKDISFLEHLMVQYPGARSIEAPGRLPYDAFSKLLSQVDLFLYPLKNGVGNWGIIEILARGGCVIATDKCFLPEVIRDGENGFLLPEDADDLWIEKILQLRDDPATRARIGAAARETGLSYSVERMAPRFMEIFERVIRERRAMRWDAPVVALERGEEKRGRERTAATG